MTLVGCGGVYRITRVTPPETPTSPPGKEKQDGILYYAKVGVCRHETKYEELVFDVVVTNTASKAVELQRSLGLKAYLDFQSKMADEAADAKMKLNGETEYVETGFNKPPLDGDLLLIANRNILETVVDYQHQYYFNAGRPISGSATAAVKIGTDGSMTEASATVQSDTLKTILSAIPTQSLFSALSPGAAIASARVRPAAGHPAYTISVTQRAYIWTVSDLPGAVSSKKDTGQCSAPLASLEISADAIKNYNVTREPLVPTDTAKKPDVPATPPPKSD
jgi:hypothetical protein